MRSYRRRESRHDRPTITHAFCQYLPSELSDMVASLASIASAQAAPMVTEDLLQAFRDFYIDEEYYQMKFPYTVDNTTTCNIQGFLFRFAFSCSTLLSAMIAVHSLLTVRYGLEEEKFRQFFEPVSRIIDGYTQLLKEHPTTTLRHDDQLRQTPMESCVTQLPIVQELQFSPSFNEEDNNEDDQDNRDNEDRHPSRLL